MSRMIGSHTLIRGLRSLPRIPGVAGEKFKAHVGSLRDLSEIEIEI